MQISLPPRAGAFAVAVVAATLISFPAAAKSHKPAQTPAQIAIAAPASLRLWKQDFASQRAVRVEIIPASGEVSAPELPIAKRGASFTEYSAWPSGDATVKVVARDNAGATPYSFPLRLDPGAFVTLILRELNGAPDLQIVNDAPAASDDASAELTVRNFAPGLEQIQVRSGDDFSVRFRARDGCLYLRGLERKLLQLDTTATAHDGKQSKWTTEVNFGKMRKATLLILADAYGRIRPRVAIDGQPPDTAPQSAATVAAAPGSILP
jgi:hypothetical protein